MLEALANHFTMKDAGAIGSLCFPPEESKKLAILSHSFLCQECGPIIEKIKPWPEETESMKKEAEEVNLKAKEDNEIQNKEIEKVESEKQKVFEGLQKTMKEFRRKVSTTNNDANYTEKVNEENEINRVLLRNFSFGTNSN